MLDYLKPAMNWLHFHPYVAYLITYLIAFSESIAVIGLIIPGSIILIAIGTLIGSGILQPTETIIAAILGALTGDFASYWLGFHYSKHLHHVWPFKRWPQLLAKGEAFFKKHGGKGVFIGRFIGPIRPITPIVAGIMKMPVLGFTLVDVTSAILWAIAYMLPGIVLGSAATSEFSSEAAPHLILTMVLGILTFACLYWLIEKFIHLLYTYYLAFEKKSWKFIQTTPRLALIKSFIYTPLAKERDHQVDLLLLLIISTIGFFWISYEVLEQGYLLHLNQALNHFFRSLRTVTVDNVMIPLTFLGEKVPMGILVLAVGITLLIKRHIRTAFYWFLNGFLAFASLGLIKTLFHIPRPLGTQGAHLHGWSFPSGHTGLSVAILGFLCLLISHYFPRVARKYLYLFVFLITLLIALSRLYLGVHWLSDVLAALCIGLACLSFCGILFRHKRNPLKPRELSLITVVALFAWLGSSSFLFYEKGQAAHESYQLTWPEKSMSFTQWWEQNGENYSPLYRSNRFGKPIQSLNIQYLGDLNALKVILIKKAWLPLNENALKTLFYKLSDPEDNTARLPVVTQQYLSRPPVLSLYKVTEDNQLLILRLWETNISIEPHNQTLIAGEINYHQAWHPHLLKRGTEAKEHSTSREIPVLSLLANEITHWAGNQHIKYADYHHYPPLNDRIDNDWAGMVLLIKHGAES